MGVFSRAKREDTRQNVPDLGTCKHRTHNRYDEKDDFVPGLSKFDLMAEEKPRRSRPQHACFSREA